MVTDGYQVYPKLGKKQHDLQIASCWIHAKRPSAEFIKSVGTEAANGSIASEACSMITEIMHIDNSFDVLTNRDCKKQRQLVLKEKVDAYFERAKLKYTQVTHNSIIGRTLAYSLKQEEYLRTFLNAGKFPMDNNYAKQAIRPFTVARKNFVLIDSSKGATASAMLFSLAETAKANGLNTYQYFELLLTEIPKHMEDKNLNFLNDLMPWSKPIQQKCPSQYKKS